MARPPKQDYKSRRNRASNFTKNMLLRLFIFNRDGGKCLKCGSTENLTLDHKVSVYRGGSDTYDNLQTLCNRCNAGKLP
jgi:5-methylcytosine-specific restriction endonuclease McrA